jgi:hypothetical protein
MQTVTERYKLLAELRPSRVHLACSQAFNYTPMPMLFAVHNSARGTRLVIDKYVTEVQA